MNAIQIPKEPITLVQAAHLLAEAVTPGNVNAARWSLNELLAAAQRGVLRGRNPLTLAPVDIADISPVDYASRMVLSGDDLRQLAAERHIRVGSDDEASMVAAPHASATHVDPGQAAPAVRWTNEALAELAEYREKYGTKRAAEQFGISGSLVRRLLPGKKMSTATPFSGLGSRAR